MKTAFLIGPVLDWAVAKCESAYISKESDEPFWLEGISAAPCFLDKYNPSTCWSQGGPISERERIAAYFNSEDQWTALIGNKEYNGPTELIAKMRCYVASKLGDEVEIPEEELL